MIGAQGLQADFKHLMMHLQGFWVLGLLGKHQCDVVPNLQGLLMSFKRLVIDAL